MNYVSEKYKSCVCEDVYKHELVLQTGSCTNEITFMMICQTKLFNQFTKLDFVHVNL